MRGAVTLPRQIYEVPFIFHCWASLSFKLSSPIALISFGKFIYQMLQGNIRKYGICSDFVDGIKNSVQLVFTTSWTLSKVSQAPLPSIVFCFASSHCSTSVMWIIPSENQRRNSLPIFGRSLFEEKNPFRFYSFRVCSTIPFSFCRIRLFPPAGFRKVATT